MSTDPSSESQWEIVDDSEDDDEESARDAAAVAELEAKQQAEQDHLNERHIKSIAHEKRAAYRNRTYMLLIAITCVVGASQLCWLAYGQVLEHKWKPVAACAVIAGGLILASLGFFRRARAYGIEAKKTAITEPNVEPDFAPLSDGSQVVENLENLER